ncbi:MAG: prolyl oligopeptidase family serine peptidase [Planctomycetaceae bacterium]|jgi:predicted peptidase|nr:prolyl oligopeptidase family serine peptidase [Planctomycetaceae bacterium]
MKIFIRFLLIIILIISLGILGYRAVYDFNLIRNGDTFIVQKSTPDGYDFLLRIPRGYNDYSGKQPLLIYLHGAGESGKDINTLKNKDPYFFSQKTLKNQETACFPFICVTPVCDTKRWEPYRVITMLDQVLSETKYRFQIDQSRIYLTGYSMGGFGTFETAMEYSERFAAIVPVAGGGEPDRAIKLRHLATWVFHGDNDQTVPLPSSELVVKTMQKLNHSNVRLTIIKDGGHGIAENVYSRSELYSWLLRQKLFDDRTRSNSGDFINSRPSR